MDASGAYWAAQVANLVNLLVGLAWPAVVLIIVATFRKQISALIGRLRTLKGWGAEGTFDPSVAEPAVDRAEAQAEAQSEPRDIRPDAAYRLNLTDRLAPLANLEPTAAVLKAYEEIENALRDRLIEANFKVDRRTRGWLLVNDASRRGVISKETAEAIRKLQELRNTAAHGGSVGVADAFAYLTLCDSVINVIETWRPEG